MESGNSYSKPNREPPTNPKELKKWKEERKALKRKWKEEKLLKQFAKKRQIEQKEEEAKKVKEEEEKVQERLGRPYTVSIALPGSILDNAQSPELRTYLAGQIARAAVVFNVDEIIVFDETGSTEKTTEGEFSGVGKHGRGNVQLARILQYLECPQYLRKSFFPQHKDLQYAGVLNPLDSPHHMRANDEALYREGVVVKKHSKEGKGSYVNVGIMKDVQVDKQLVPGVRVTVKMDLTSIERKKNKGTVVPPSEPRTHAGLYWGYSVRLASSIGAVFTECSYKEVYDLTIGTSERGSDIDDFELDKKDFKHALIVFGGVHGLETSLEADENLAVDDPSLLFQHYINTCPQQGSRTIRTEEAILITMSALRPKLFTKQSKTES
ncbi:putative methyltransferase C9orf114 homolog [Ruditapes philippinarum]|uniref:putative methyltransferase C9orf114 homolog n=1 Tax=Ruditapes philippinarum TaxID=129788 RepID=UPI00295BD7F5|nr:putative methyltransferase C9orf114 homolog [Ruditapes philippinarum]